jgi:hypothetical protein
LRKHINGDVKDLVMVVEVVVVVEVLWGSILTHLVLNKGKNRGDFQWVKLEWGSLWNKTRA